MDENVVETEKIPKKRGRPLKSSKQSLLKTLNSVTNDINMPDNSDDATMKDLTDKCATSSFNPKYVISMGEQLEDENINELNVETSKTPKKKLLKASKQSLKKPSKLSKDESEVSDNSDDETMKKIKKNTSRPKAKQSEGGNVKKLYVEIDKAIKRRGRPLKASKQPLETTLKLHKGDKDTSDNSDKETKKDSTEKSTARYSNKGKVKSKGKSEGENEETFKDGSNKIPKKRGRPLKASGNTGHSSKCVLTIHSTDESEEESENERKQITRVEDTHLKSDKLPPSKVFKKSKNENKKSDIQKIPKKRGRPLKASGNTGHSNKCIITIHSTDESEEESENERKQITRVEDIPLKSNKLPPSKVFKNSKDENKISNIQKDEISDNDISKPPSKKNTGTKSYKLSNVESQDSEVSDENETKMKKESKNSVSAKCGVYSSLRRGRETNYEDYFDSEDCASEAELNESDDDVEISDEKKLISCATCGIKCSTYLILKYHIQNIHSRYQKCVLCQECFNSKPALKYHMKLNHPESKLYPCTFRNCNASFEKIRMFREHEKEHYPYSCKYCKKGFKTIFFMRKHIKKTHN